jgi:PhnB protein
MSGPSTSGGKREGAPLPSGYRGAIPYLNVRGGWNALAFYRRAFAATEVVSLARDGGFLAHAELAIAGAVIMVRDEYPDYGFLSPQTVGGTGCEILIYVEDVWSFVDRAAAEGAQVVRPVERQFHGDEMAVLKDPYGHVWFFATRVEEMSPEKLRRIAAESPL